MKIISRYITKEIFFIFIIGFFIFTFFLIMNSLFVMSDLVIKYGINLLTVIKLLFLLLPSTVAVTVPMAFLAGVLLTYSRLVQDNEYYGMQASGIKVSNIALPGVALSVFVMACMIFFNNSILPAANLSYKNLYHDIVKKRSSVLIQEHTFIKNFDNYVFYIGGRDNKTDTLKNVIVFVKPGKAGTQDNAPPEVILADKGKLISDPDSLRIALKLNDGLIQIGSYTNPAKMSQINFDTNYVDLDIKGVLRSRSSGRNLKGAREMTIKELMAEAKKGKESKKDIDWIMIELYKKVSLPFAAVAFTLVGIPLGLLTKKGGKITGISFSIGLIFIYYILLSLGQNYGYRGKMDHFLAAWLPNIFLVGAGALLFAGLYLPAIKRKFTSKGRGK